MLESYQVQLNLYIFYNGCHFCCIPSYRLWSELTASICWLLLLILSGMFGWLQLWVLFVHFSLMLRSVQQLIHLRFPIFSDYQNTSCSRLRGLFCIVKIKFGNGVAVGLITLLPAIFVRNCGLLISLALSSIVLIISSSLSARIDRFCLDNCPLLALCSSVPWAVIMAD